MIAHQKVYFSGEHKALVGIAQMKKAEQKYRQLVFLRNKDEF